MLLKATYSRYVIFCRRFDDEAGCVEDVDGICAGPRVLARALEFSDIILGHPETLVLNRASSLYKSAWCQQREGQTAS